jgi:hypothetical protein
VYAYSTFPLEYGWNIVSWPLILIMTQVGLQPLQSFIEKSIQLYEMVLVRHGLMLVCTSTQNLNVYIYVSNWCALALQDSLLYFCISGSGLLSNIIYAF